MRQRAGIRCRAGISRACSKLAAGRRALHQEFSTRAGYPTTEADLQPISSTSTLHHRTRRPDVGLQNHGSAFRVAEDIFNFIRQLLDFGFEQVEQQVQRYRRPASDARMVQAEAGNSLAQRTGDSRMVMPKTAGVIFGIFKSENKVDV